MPHVGFSLGSAESRLVVDAVAASYRLAAQRLGTLAQQTGAAGRRCIRSSGQVVLPTATQAANGIIQVTAAHFAPPAGRELVLMLAVALDTNDVAPAASYTFALTPVTAVGGANGINSVTLGADVADSDVVFTTPAANTPDYDESDDFAPPADGPYLVTIDNDVSNAASSDLSFVCSLLWRWVDAA